MANGGARAGSGAQPTVQLWKREEVQEVLWSRWEVRQAHRSRPCSPLCSPPEAKRAGTRGTRRDVFNTNLRVTEKGLERSC